MFPPLRVMRDQLVLHLHLRTQLPKALLGADRLGGEPRGRRIGQLTLQGLALAGRSLQPGLLTLGLVAQSLVLGLQGHETADLRPIRGAHQVRQHVHVAEHALAQFAIHIRMCEHGPVRAGDLACGQRLTPAG